MIALENALAALIKQATILQNTVRSLRKEPNPQNLPKHLTYRKIRRTEKEIVNITLTLTAIWREITGIPDAEE